MGFCLFVLLYILVCLGLCVHVRVHACEFVCACACVRALLRVYILNWEAMFSFQTREAVKFNRGSTFWCVSSGLRWFRNWFNLPLLIARTWRHQNDNAAFWLPCHAGQSMKQEWCFLGSVLMTQWVTSALGNRWVYLRSIVSSWRC